MTTEINKTLFSMCRKYCSGIEFCSADGFCDYMEEIKKNIIKIIVKTEKVNDEE